MRVERAGRAGGGTPSSKMPSGPRRRRRAVVSAVEAERLREPSRTGAEITLAARLRTSGEHHVDAHQRCRGAQEDRAGVARRRERNDVRAPVHAVGEVHVEPARTTEHRGVPRGATAVRVTRRVLRPAVRLDLHDADDQPTDFGVVVHQQLVQEIRRELAGVAREERRP